MADKLLVLARGDLDLVLNAVWHAAVLTGSAKLEDVVDYIVERLRDKT